MAKIGSITAKITANTEGLVTGLQKAQTILNGTIAKMQQQLKGFATTAAGVLTGNLLTDAVKGGLGRLVGLFTEGQDAVLGMGKAARKAGVDIGSMQVLAEAMGGDTEKAAEAFLKLNENIGKAVVEGMDQPFEKLGLDALELSGMKASDRLTAIAEKLSAIQDPIARARVGTQLFGDQFKEVAGVLEDGGRLLDETGKSLVSFGAAFGENQLKTAKEAEQAFKQISFLYKGLVNQIGAAIAPIVAELTAAFGKLSDYGITFDGLKDKIIDVAEFIAKAGAFIRESFANPELIIKAWNAIFEYIKAGLNDIKAGLLDSVSSIPGMSGKALEAEGYRDLAKAQRNLGKAMTKKLGEELAVLPSFQKVDDFFSKIRDRVQEVGDVAKKNNFADLFAQGLEKVKDGLKSSLDTFREDAGRITKMMEFGRKNSLLTAGAEQTLLQGLGQKVMSLAGSSRPEVKFAGAMTQGSREAYSAIIANQFTKRESVQELIARLQQEQLEQQRQQVKYGKEAAEALRGLEVQGLN